MKLASILSLIALLDVLPFSASVEYDDNCTITAVYYLDHTTSPTNAEEEFAAGALLSSYNGYHNIVNTPGVAEHSGSYNLTETGSRRSASAGEEKQHFAENLRGKVSEYSEFANEMMAWLSLRCSLCVEYDTSATSSSVTNHAAVSVVLEEKKRAVQKKHDHGLSISNSSDTIWAGAWCDELTGYDEPPFEYAYGCTIEYTCPP
jgi:hypothetical protein